METIELIIDKNQIEAILNGERIEQEVDGIKYVIRQSYLQPMAMPLVNRPKGYTTFKSKAYVTEDTREALIIAIKHDGDVEKLEKENEE